MRLRLNGTSAACPPGSGSEPRRAPIRSLALTPLLALVLIAGCGGGGDEAPTPSKQPPGGELAVYTRSGGLAFSTDQLAIDTEGHAVLASEDGEGARRVEFDLTSRELGDLEAALAAARGLEVPPPIGACADCYSYSIQAEGVSISLDDASFGSSGLPAEVPALIQMLGDLVNRQGDQAR